MFSLRKPKSPLNKNAMQNSVHPGFGGYPSSNPFDSDDYLSSSKKTHIAPLKTSRGPARIAPNLSTNPFGDDNEGPQTSTSFYSRSLAKTNKYKYGFRDCGGLENQTVQELEDYAVYKAEETTKNVNSCLKIAKNIREDATKTLVLLHHQGKQITKTHTVAADIDIDLSRGEKLLRRLGGIFSRTWKPTKTRTITGPTMTREDPVRRKGNHLEQRERFGLTSASKGRLNMRTPPAESANTMQKVELEEAKQDGALSELSNLLEELKDMAVDMGSAIDRQNKAFDPFLEDVKELNFRVRGANQRGRRLLAK